MNRRQFLEATATTGTIGLLAGCLNSEASEDGSTTESENDPATESEDESTNENEGTPTTDEPTETETATSTPDDGEPIGDDTTTESDRSRSVGWSSGGVMDGVSFEFSSRAPECSEAGEMAAIDETDIEFDTDADEIRVGGIISGSDLCKRARLADLTYDREESHLSVAIESIDREDCDAGGQCITEIAYEGTFSVDDGIPESTSVSHDGRGVASAAHGSTSAGPAEETTAE